MKKAFVHILALVTVVVLSSCNEKIDLKTAPFDKTFLSVECILTGTPMLEQVVKLSESVEFFLKEPIGLNAPAVSGAKVTISDGVETVAFTEKPDGQPGSYYAPSGYFAVSGKTYTLNIEVEDVLGEVHKYEASSTMTESACRLDAVDYKQIDEVQDSTISIAIWGQASDEAGFLLAVPFINQSVWPISSAFGLDNKYYRGQYLSGFPISLHKVSWERYHKGEGYKKPLEIGDMLGVSVLTLTPEFYDFFMSYFYNEKARSIPLIASQPANVNCNIKGEDVVGFFTTAPVTLSYCFVDDPDRKEYRIPVE